MKLIGLTLAAGWMLQVAALPASEAGRKVFEARCASCHSLSKAERLDVPEIASARGPALYSAGVKFQPAWLARWLVKPVRIRPAGFLSFRYVVPTPDGDVVGESRIPAHPALTPAASAVVTAFLTQQVAELNPHPASTAESGIPGRTHFEKVLGCAACHMARGGNGGLSGPDLSTAAERLRPEWFASFMSDPLYWGALAKPKGNARSDQASAVAQFLFATSEQDERIAAKQALQKPAGEPDPLPEDRAALVYRVLCTQCHGVRGNGKGINARTMFVSPRDHTSVREMGALTDDRLFAVIKYGGTAVGKSVLMPSWSAVLKDADIRLLIDYLRGLSGTRVALQAERRHGG